jgi:hypothetical protein
MPPCAQPPRQSLRAVHGMTCHATVCSAISPDFWDGHLEACAAFKSFLKGTLINVYFIKFT